MVADTPSSSIVCSCYSLLMAAAFAAVQAGNLSAVVLDRDQLWMCRDLLGLQPLTASALSTHLQVHKAGVHAAQREQVC